MGSLFNEKFACIDCETTGLNEDDRIIEVAVAVFDMRELHAAFETLVNPLKEISEDNQKIHHISNEMVHEKPLIEEVLPEVLELIGDRIIVGHGVKFDIDHLVCAAKRSRIPCELEKNLYFDTLRMARIYGESPRNSLEMLREHFNINEEGAHRAMNDVQVNIEVFRKLALDYRTTEKLTEALGKPILLKTMPLGKYKGRLFRDVPVDYLKWLARKDFDQDLMFSIRSEIKRRKHGKLFEQESNPFKNL